MQETVLIALAILAIVPKLKVYITLPFHRRAFKPLKVAI